jgi:hypothetical protein
MSRGFPGHIKRGRNIYLPGKREVKWEDLWKKERIKKADHTRNGVFIWWMKLPDCADEGRWRRKRTRGLKPGK